MPKRISFLVLFILDSHSVLTGRWADYSNPTRTGPRSTRTSADYFAATTVVVAPSLPLPLAVSCLSSHFLLDLFCLGFFIFVQRRRFLSVCFILIRTTEKSKLNVNSFFHYYFF